jgi:hypothetical protein
MKREFRAKLNGDESHDDATASFTLPFDTREVWGKARDHLGRATPLAVAKSHSLRGRCEAEMSAASGQTQDPATLAAYRLLP